MSLKEWMAQPQQYVQGKKTYIVAMAICALGLLEAFNIWSVPEYVWPLLGALGLGFMRSGVNGVKNSIKEIAMDKIKILLIAFLLLFEAGAARANGLTVWGMTEQNVTGTQNSLVGRVGYRYDFIEPFVESTWRPRFNVEENEISPPQIFSAGCLVHMRDLLDPNNPLPWLPQALLVLIPENMVAQPYFGVMGTVNLIDQDAGATGFPVGVLLKQEESSKSSFVIEARLFNQNFGDLTAVPDDPWTLYFGFCIYFGK